MDPGRHTTSLHVYLSPIHLSVQLFSCLCSVLLSFHCFSLVCTFLLFYILICLHIFLGFGSLFVLGEEVVVVITILAAILCWVSSRQNTVLIQCLGKSKHCSFWRQCFLRAWSAVTIYGEACTEKWRTRGNDKQVWQMRGMRGRTLIKLNAALPSGEGKVLPLLISCCSLFPEKHLQHLIF